MLGNKVVELYYKDKTVWYTQKAMGMLFDSSTDNVGLHLKNIFASGELVKDSVTEKISATESALGRLFHRSTDRNKQPLNTQFGIRRKLDKKLVI